MDQWLTQVRDALAEAGNLPADELALDNSAAAILLDLAGLAAHESGTRTNAPLLCYLVGRAERNVDLDTLASAIRRVSADAARTGEKEET